MTKEEAETMALKFLADGGPHTMPREIADEGQLAAAMIFLSLERKGHVSREIVGSNLVISLTARGRLRQVKGPSVAELKLPADVAVTEPAL